MNMASLLLLSCVSLPILVGPIIGASLSEPHMGSKSVPRELSIYVSVLRKPWIWNNPWIVLRKAWIGRYPQFAQGNPWIAPRRAGGSLKRKRTMVARSE